MEFLNDITTEKSIVDYYDIIDALEELCINSGDNIIVHCSLSKIGYLIGGVETLYRALKFRIGLSGNIIVPSQSIELSHPKTWRYPPLKKQFINKVSDGILGYDSQTTPVSPSLGVFCEYITMLKDTVRTQHPLYSFAINGKDSKKISKFQNLDLPFGSNSPLDWLYQNNGKILMIGTDFETNTSIHLAESKVFKANIIEEGKIRKKGRDEWVKFKNVELGKYDDYTDIERIYLHKYMDFYKVKGIGNTSIRIFCLKSVVDFCIEYYLKKENNI